MSAPSDTDTVIHRLARQSGAPLHASMRLEAALLLAALTSLGIALGLVFLIYGVAPDFRATVTGEPFRHKVESMLALAAGGIALAVAMGRPGASRLWIIGLLPGVALLVFGAVADRSGYPFLGRSGISVPSCLGVIILLSVPALAIMLAVLRATGVVTRPALAGGVAGLVSGALGAAAYALACRNDGGLFVAVWYGTAVTAVALAGALAGRRWLAW